MLGLIGVWWVEWSKGGGGAWIGEDDMDSLIHGYLYYYVCVPFSIACIQLFNLTSPYCIRTTQSREVA